MLCHHHLTFRRFFIIFILILIFQLFLLAIIYNWDNFKSGHVDKSEKSKTFETCSIDDNQAISALNRMKTRKCKNKLIETFCTIKHNHIKLWSDVLHSRCNHFDKNNHQKLITCHSDFDAKQLLQKFTKNTKKSTKVLLIDNWQSCVDLCLQIDFEYTLYYSSDNYCICTNDFRSIFDSNHQNLSTLNSKCDFQCAINVSNCPKHLFIYSTGIKKFSYYLPALEIINESIDSSKIRKPKIVFLLLFSGRSVNQANRLLKNIYRSWHYYYIHVDSRDDYLFDELLYLERKYSNNIKLHRRRFNSIWGGASLLTTILDCLADILQLWSDWDFVLNISETDFPIKKIDQLERYLAKNLDKNFIKSHGKNTFDFIQTQALNKVFLQCERHMWRILNRQLPKGIVWDGGSDWVILNRNFSQYLTYSKDQLLRNLINYFQYSLLPAESFFHVVLRNTEYCSTIVNNNLRATNWNRKKGCRCQQKNVVDWCGCSPNVFRIKDLSRLMLTQEKPLFFARKFEHIIDSDILDFVELRFLSNNFGLEDSYGNFYLQNHFHLKYDQHFGHLNIYKLDFYKHFIGKTLNLLSKNFNADDFKLLEANFLFKNNRFFGTLLKFNNSNQHSEVEILLKKFNNETLLFAEEQTRPKLRSIKVCNKYDEKEEIFRNYECLLNESDHIQVMHEWHPFFGQYNITFVLIDPKNRIFSIHEIKVNNTEITNYDEDIIRMVFNFPDNQSKPSGIYKLIVLNENGWILGAHRFILLPSISKSQNDHSNYSDLGPNGQHFKEIINPLLKRYSSFFSSTNDYGEIWFIDKICVQNRKGELEKTRSNETIIQEKSMEICDDVNWSSYNRKIGFSL